MISRAEYEEVHEREWQIKTEWPEGGWMRLNGEDDMAVDIVASNTARRTYMGSHDVSAVMGLHPYRSPLDVYLAKTGEGGEQEQTEPMEWGLRAQDMILAKHAERHEVNLTHEKCVRHPAFDWLGGTPDGIWPGGEVGVDAKNIRWRSAKWGEDGSDHVPVYVLLQAHHLMLVTGAERWYIAALFSGQEYAEFQVRRDEEWDAILLREGQRFWEEHVVPRVPPLLDGSDAAKRLLARSYPSHDKRVLAATTEQAALLDSLVVARQTFDTAEMEKKSVENRVKGAIGDAYGIEWAGGKITWGQVKGRGGIDVKKLAETYPKAHEDCWKMGAGYRRFHVRVKS